MPKLKNYEEQTNSLSPSEAQLFTTKELSVKIKMSPQMLAMLRIQGGGPRFFKASKGKCAKVLYDWKDVVAYLEANKRNSTSDQGGGFHG